MVSIASTPEYAVGRDDDPDFQCPSRDRAIGLVQLSVDMLEEISSSRALYIALLQLRTLTEQLVRDYPVHTQSTIRVCRQLCAKILHVIQDNCSMHVQSGQAGMEELITIFQNRQAHFENDALTRPGPQSSPACPVSYSDRGCLPQEAS